MSRRVVVTGTASGIGRALAQSLSKEGEEVLAIDLKDADVQADLSTTEGRERAIREAQRFGGGALDALVTCAGLSGNSPEIVGVNYFGTVELCEGLRDVLAQAPSPRVAVVGSVSALHPVDAGIVEACLEGEEGRALARAAERTDAGAGHELYPSSKAALARWVRRSAISDSWAGEGIALNAVAPGVVLTPMTDILLADEETRRMVEKAVPMPLNGHAPPEAVADLLAWLIGEANTHVTGQVIYVDGGAEVTYRGDSAW